MKDHKRAFVSLKKEGLSSTGKTEIWEVFNLNEDDYLGVVKWYGPWRKYVFHPGDDTFFDDECMKEISIFLIDLNFVHKSSLESKRQGANV